MLCKILKLNDQIVIGIFYLFVLSGILLLSSFIVKPFFYNEIEREKKRSLCYEKLKKRFVLVGVMVKWKKKIQPHCTGS